MRKKRLINCSILFSAVVIMMLMAGVSLAAPVSYDLTADDVTITMPDAAPILMWGFGLDGGPVSVPGPVLEANEGDDLTINLTNNLPEPVTIVIHGQRIASPTPVMVDGRVMSFVPESTSFTFPGLKAGTYLYESGTHPAKQVQMGLYGVLIVRPATPGQAYDDPVSAYDREQVLLFSDIDPFLHEAVQNQTYGTLDYPSTVNYRPQYFLINGKAYPDTEPISANSGEAVLLRLANAGLKTYDPMINGLRMTIIAEDGNLLPFPSDVISVSLHAGKTNDVIVSPPAGGQYALFDRRLNLSNAGAAGIGGMFMHMNVASAPPPVIDSFTATPQTITVGQSSTLAWATTNADAVSIDQGVGSQPVDGSVVVSPARTTVYTLTATGPGGAATSSVTVTVLPITATFVSTATQDGWLRESFTQANVGGAADVNDADGFALRIGDQFFPSPNVEPQYKSLVSFNTATLPDGAVIDSATLRLVRGGLAGVNPFTTHAPCYVDIITGAFSGNSALQIVDFQAAATATAVATMSNPPTNGSASTGALNSAGLAAINKTGLTQLRIYFAIDDNDDRTTDGMGFYSGENAAPANRPVLEVKYFP